MDPVSRGKSIQYVVCRLIRTWIRTKYGVEIPDFVMQCGGMWEDDVMADVLDRVRAVPVLTNDGISCEIDIRCARTLPGFQACLNWVDGQQRASILPPLLVRTKSGEWVLVVNQGHGKLQGHTMDSGTDYVYVDATTFDTGCPIYDVKLSRYERRDTVCRYLCCCFGGIPPLTPLYKAGNTIDVSFRQTELDTALLESTDDYEGVLS